MLLRRYSDGNYINIYNTSPLGAGGEARIYAIPQFPGLAAKIYHEPTIERAQKLSVMISNPPDDPMAFSGHVSIAWPMDLVYSTNNGEYAVGFLMPLVNRMRPIFDFYNPRSRRKHCPLFNYLYLHRSAGNLCAGVNALHERGYVIGDINESNILVSDTALATLIDTDSFQVSSPDNGNIFRCTVGKPEFTPPELQGKTFADTDREPYHDLFGLAVLIFQLLMEGTHPFTGVYQGKGDPPSYQERILSGHFPYGRKRVPYRLSLNAPPFEILNPVIQSLFLRCFEDGKDNPQIRPDAKTWQNALIESEESLIACGVNNQHLYGKHLDKCPWCERKARFKGLDPFPSKKDIQEGKVLTVRKGSVPQRRRSIITLTRAATYTPLPVRRMPVRTPIRIYSPIPASIRLARSRNDWAMIAVGLAIIAFILGPVLNLWTNMIGLIFEVIISLGAIACGFIGLRNSWRLAGSGRIMAVTAAGISVAMLMTSFYNPGSYSIGFRRPSDVQIPKESREFENIPYKGPGTSLPSNFSSKDGVSMILIPGGDFMMGSRDGDYDEKPVRKVRINPFYIDKYEVTNRQYAKFLNEYGSNEDAAGHKLVDIDSFFCLMEKADDVYRPKAGYEDHPVVTVSWYGAAAYAQFYGKRLPTEAEWEKAARGRLISQKYQWGSGLSQDYANVYGADGKDKWWQTSPVGSFAPNSYGLYDMTGNVWEFCADEYDPRSYIRGTRDNPTGPGMPIRFTNNDFSRVDNSSRRVARGGSWNDDLYLLRAALRSWFNPDASFMMLGFRCTKD